MTTYDNSTTGEQMVMLKDLKVGTFFKRKADAKTVFVRGSFDRTSKKFECNAYEDGNDMFLKGTTLVFIGFTY